MFLPMEWLDWKWALGLALWSVVVFRFGFGIGRLARSGDDVVPIAPTRISPQARARVADALSRGKKIEAIRILREDTGCALAEARVTVESMTP